MTMPDCHVRPLTGDDIAACESLAVDRGWDVGEARWRLMLDVGRGWGCSLPDGTLAGTALLLAYEDRVGLAAMVLVRTSLARRGIARHLMSTLLADAPPLTYLYATDMGRPLYEQLGFVATEQLVQFAGIPRLSPQVDGDCEVRALLPGDLASVLTLDQRCFGVSRARMLARMVADANRMLGAWRGDVLLGAGFASQVGRHTVIGPVLALDDDVGRCLLDALATDQAQPIRIDAPASRDVALRWARGVRLVEQPAVPLMVLGGRRLPGQRQHLVTIGSRALG